MADDEIQDIRDLPNLTIIRQYLRVEYGRQWE